MGYCGFDLLVAMEVVVVVIVVFVVIVAVVVAVDVVAVFADANADAAAADDDESFGDEGDEVATPTPSASKAPTNTAKPTATAAPTTTAAPTNTKEPTKKPAATPTPTSTKATPPPAPTGAKGNGPGVGDELYYKYGSIQLAVVKSGNAISEVKVLKATTEGSEFSHVPADLAKAAIAANGTNFANVSGATYTSNAFRKSLESALAKL
jgi:uncharacterized protein with FMN-binding domain